MRKKVFKRIIIIAVAAFLGLLTLCSFLVYQNIPENIVLYKDGKSVFNLNIPAVVSFEDSVGAASINGERLSDKVDCNLLEPVEISAEEDTQIQVSAFGIFPIKTVDVSVKEETAPKYLYVGGESMGVTLYTKGALIVGVSEVVNEKGENVSPGKEAGLKAGDVIISADGKEIQNSADLSKIVNQAKGDTITLKIRREQTEYDVEIHPEKDSYDSVSRLGVWVRDSTAGVGTITFYDKDTGKFGGLGHAITDLDTGSKLSVKNGNIISSEIIDVVKGEAGSPGELKGYFDAVHDKIGTLEINSDYGIFGSFYKDKIDFSGKELLEVGKKQDVHSGEGYIISTVDDEGAKKFKCYISEVEITDEISQKNFVVTITDEELLKKTGGIVQGQSGSPVIQDGKLIGAVTHVFVNDPTKGYGIFAETMLSKSQE